MPGMKMVEIPKTKELEEKIFYAKLLQTDYKSKLIIFKIDGDVIEISSSIKTYHAGYIGKKENKNPCWDGSGKNERRIEKCTILKYGKQILAKNAK